MVVNQEPNYSQIIRDLILGQLTRFISQMCQDFSSKMPLSAVVMAVAHKLMVCKRPVILKFRRIFV